MTTTQTHWYHDCPAWRLARDAGRLVHKPAEVSCLTCRADMQRDAALTQQGADDGT